VVKRKGAVEDMVNPWEGRRVFLTGHTGFKGGWLALWLANRGAKVRGYSLDPISEPNLFSSTSLGDVLEDVRGDIRDFDSVHRAMSEFSPEVVFHLAAQPLVRSSYADPLGTYATNVMGTAHVLEAVRKTEGVRAVVVVTTDKCYSNQEWIWPYRETDALGGHDPYSSSKASAEIICAAYRSSFFPPDRWPEHGVGLATARAGNVIGGGDWSEDRLIPDLIRGFQAKRSVPIRSPKSIRPWQHVLESLHGYMLLAERLLARDRKAASSFNFGPDADGAWEVCRVADTVAGMWGEGANWIGDAVPALHEAQTLKLDSSKARADLGWSPKLRTETALDWSLSWYRGWQRGENMQALSRFQILAYERLAGYAGLGLKH